MTIPVICDRCRTTGIAGTGDFSHLGDLLDFDPVVVKHRVNGWDPEAQRAFIALLATTGSKRRAAQAIGRNAFGIDQLLKRPDSASFRTAYERALALADRQGAMKIAQGVADAAARNAQLTPPSRLANMPPEDDDSGMSDETKRAMLHNIFVKFMRKVEQEREARVDGRIIEADFALRQITSMEIALEMMAEGFGLGGWEALGMVRRGEDGEHGFVSIPETPMSRMLDNARRQVWIEHGEPERPEHPLPANLEHHGDYSLDAPAAIHGGPDAERAARKAALDQQHRENAAAQMEWEAKARREYDERRASDASA